MNTNIPSDDSGIPPFLDLCSQDARALEALLECDLDCDRVPVEMRERARRCAAVLGLLGCGGIPVCDESLIDATLVRVAWSRRAAGEVSMAPLDEDALEALVGAGFDPKRCPSAIRERAVKHAAILSQLDVPIDGSSREVLVSATLTRVQASIDGGQKRLRIDASPARARPQFRWGDLISVAALLLIASAVVLPMVASVREHGRQTACLGGLGSAGQGFGTYANDFREALPMASASLAGGAWWDIGKPEHSNSANLYTLIRTGHAPAQSLTCPSNEIGCRMAGRDVKKTMDWSCSDEISYSYQNLFAPERPHWNQQQKTVVLADRSPVTVRAMRGDWINPIANSDNHAQLGQNVLFNDGEGRWMKTPVLANGDNMWLPRALEEALAKAQNPTRAEPLRGNESPAGAADVFLSP